MQPLERFLSLGVLSVAMFVVIMYAGTLDEKNEYIRRLLGIRYELSVMASVFFFAHTIPNIFAFKRFIPLMRSDIYYKIMLHGLAYAIYVSVYLYIAFLCFGLPVKQYGKFFLYSIIFLPYFVLGMRKKILKKKIKKEILGVDNNYEVG